MRWQFAPEMLLDKSKGMSSIFRNFPKLKFKGKGHEVSKVLAALFGMHAVSTSSASALVRWLICGGL